MSKEEICYYGVNLFVLALFVLVSLFMSENWGVVTLLLVFFTWLITSCYSIRGLGGCEDDFGP